MKINKSTDGVLVCDRYYASKPKAALLILERTALCVLLAVCPMMYILTEYNMPVSLLSAAAFGAVFAAGLSVVFVFVRKLAALPVLAAVAGLWVYSRFEWISSRLAYFADACMLLVEGRFLYPRPYLLHDEVLLNGNNPLYAEGVTLGCVILCVIFALVCALSLSGKLRALPPIIAFALLCVPVLISERIDFNIWIIPTAALFAACITISRCYHDGLAVKHFGHTAYERIVKQEERRFIDNTRRAPFAKRLEMRTNYYSKYFAAGMYCAAIFAVLITVVSSFFDVGQAIDYTPVYEWAMNLGRDSGAASPFDEGVGADYFSSTLPGNPDALKQSGALNIISPGRGERELLRVTYTGDRPIYLRGDIGVEFQGSSWTSMYGNEPASWTGTGLKELYRPCELEVVKTLLDVGGAADDIISRSDVKIEYLTETSIVFLPNYTAEYTYYSNDTFNIYGDFVVRVDSEAGSYMNSVDCTALIPSYIGTEKHGGVDAIAEVRGAFRSAGVTVDDIYATVVPDMNGTMNVFSQYEQYVEETYTGIPDEYKQRVLSFMESAGISSETQSLRAENSLNGDGDAAMINYSIAQYLSDYLRDNYTYTLDTVNLGGNAVINFLTYSKRGHCSLYASALTLMLRAEGIPARYCTGFFVAPKKGSAGGTEVLREKNTHAWVEVYLGDMGWVTFDPTSSSSALSDNSGEAYETRDTASKPEPSSSESQPDKPVYSESETASFGGSEEAQAAEHEQQAAAVPPLLLLSAAIAVILTALAAAVIFTLVKRWKNLKTASERRIDRLFSDSAEQGAYDAYHLLLEIFGQLGITPAKGELPQSFFERADRTLGTKLAERYQLLEAIEFGEKAAAEEERRIIAEELSGLYGRLMDSAGLRKKIKIMQIISRKR